MKLLAQDGELYILAQSRARIFKERGMRQRRLKKLWRRLHELRGQSLRRDELLLKLGAAKKEAGRTYHLVDIRLPQAGEAVNLRLRAAARTAAPGPAPRGPVPAALQSVVSRNRSWGPHGNWSQCSVAGFTGKTEQSGSRLEPVPSPLS